METLKQEWQPTTDLGNPWLSYDKQIQAEKLNEKMDSLHNTEETEKVLHI